MPSSPIVLVQDGAGPFLGTVGGNNVTPGNTISIKLQTPGPVTAWYLEIFGVDEVTVTAPTLVGVNPSTHLVATPATIVTFVMPAGVGIGRAIVLRSWVDGGGSGLTTTFGIYVLTSAPARVGAAGEKFEGDPIFGWATKVNPLIRTGASAPTGPAGNDLGGAYPNPDVLRIHGTSVPIAGAPEIGKVLTVFASGVATWQTSSGFTAGGDLSGTPSSQTVIKINGTTVPVSLVGDIGKALFVTAAGVSAWQTVTQGVVVKDEGSTVTGGPHTALNFIGPGIAATDAGGGQANITVTGTIDVQDEGSTVTGGPHTTVNFAGAGVTASDAGGGVALVTIPQGAPTIQEEGVPLGGGPHSTLNFIGASVTAADAGGGVANITVAGITALPEVEVSLEAGVFSTTNAAFTRAGSRTLDPLYWPAAIGALTRSVYFKADIEVSTGGTTANVRLQNITDNETVTGTALSTGLLVNTEVTSVALTVGVAVGDLKSGTPKQYEVQVSLTGGGAGDTVTITNARLCIRYA
jgi:hypothetical protein